MLCALIMAGGKGTRFWPLSTEDKPKQFLKLINNETMLQMTVKRIRKIIPIERIFICTGEKYLALVQEQLPELNRRNIIIEPEGRNTAPCIAASAFIINEYYENANMIVLPSDHLIRNEEEFIKVVEASDKFVQKHKSSIVTLGMKPSRAEVGYGYIKIGNQVEEIIERKIVKVDKFVEKPKKQLAEEYVRDGRYLWNGGMFIWSAKGILEQIKKYLPNTYYALKDIEITEENDFEAFIRDNYSKTDKISIDYAVLEKSNEVYVVPADIGWDDVGSWEAVERYRKVDGNGNIVMGQVASLNSKNNIIIAGNSQVIIDNIEDIFVIENDGKIIIGKRNNINKVKEFKEII